MDKHIEKQNSEFTSLNIDEIDVQELEKRLELAVASHAPWSCDGFTKNSPVEVVPESE